MTAITPPGNGLPDNLPLLTEVADDLPTLTEVVEAQPASYVPDDGEIQQLLRQLESRIEEIFARRLVLDLERAQREAIEQALEGLKAELPRLLRDALKVRTGL